MPRYDPHPVLGRQAAECLRLLADPELPPETPLPVVPATEAPILVRAARVHGTAATAFRHVRARAAAGAGTPAAIADAFAAAEPTIMASIGHSMRLRFWGERVAARFRDAGVPFAIVKGPVFAARLYRNTSDRLYSDVDILVPEGSVAGAFAILANLGFFSDDIPNRDAAAHREFKWTLGSEKAVQVELQTDLIHSPRQRRRVSVGLDEIVAAGDGDAADATAILFVAAVHAALGHQFDRLELLVDVLQAMRGRAGPVDTDRLIRIAERSGTLRAIAASLALTGRMYRDPECLRLARSMLRGITPEWSLVTPPVVVKALSRAGRSVSWRRKMFRRLVTRPASPRGEGGAARRGGSR